MLQNDYLCIYISDGFMFIFTGPIPVINLIFFLGDKKKRQHNIQFWWQILLIECCFCERPKRRVVCRYKVINSIKWCWSQSPVNIWSSLKSEWKRFWYHLWRLQRIEWLFYFGATFRCNKISKNPPKQMYT